MFTVNKSTLGMSALVVSTLSHQYCAAQETFSFRLHRAVTPDSQEASVAIWAVFDEVEYALASARFELEAVSGLFVDADLLFDGGPCEVCPTPEDRFVRTIWPGQLHFPVGGIYGNPSNPVAVASAIWTTDDFTPRDVPIETHTTGFDVYTERESSRSESRMDTFEEGSDIIRVRRCYTDCDGDDETTIFDFLCFMNAFEAGDFYADCDESGTLDVFDFICFQNEFMAGCP